MAQAFIIGRDFINGEKSALILGDNICRRQDFESHLKDASDRVDDATVFAYHVHDPERYGVVEFDAKKRAVSIEEKPRLPKSNYAVTGLYFYDRHVCDIAKSIKPSPRSELEITDVNQAYLNAQQLPFPFRHLVWMDFVLLGDFYGTHGNNFLKTILRLANEREILRVIADQSGAPTFARSIAKATHSAIKAVDTGDIREEIANCTGIYHFCAARNTSWHGYAQHINIL